MTQEQNLYDAVAYPGGANSKSHPDHMAAMGILYGLQPAPVATCRVLEIGCSEGHNIVPMAYSIPGGQFVGVDLAAEPIAEGQRRIQRLGLNNVRLIQADLLELDESLGTFDYIIAHGVYAWVPQFVRDGLMAAFKKLLAPQGIAFVSYNALPGGHIRNMVREMMLSHSPDTGDTAKDVKESINYLQFIIQSMPEDEPARAAMERELEQLRKKGANVTFHDEFTSAYKPVSYSTLARHAIQHGLEPLCDSDFPPPIDPSFNPDVSEIVRALSEDPIQQEQTFDFIRMRLYRETLLCHAGPTPGHRPDINLAAVEHLRLATQVVRAAPSKPDEDPDADPNAVNYRTPKGNDFAPRNPGIHLILDHLASMWPRSVPVTQLRTMLEEHGLAFDDAFRFFLFKLVLYQVFELHSWQTPVAAQPPLLPRVSNYCRDAAIHGGRTVSLLHRGIDLSDPILRTFISMLDGTREPASLVDVLHERHPNVSKEKIVDGLGSTLDFFHRMGLLIEEDFE